MSTHDLIRRLNEIAEVYENETFERSLEPAWFQYLEALSTAASAYRACLDAATFRDRLITLARAERQMGVAIGILSIARRSGNEPIAEHAFLFDAGAYVLSLVANGTDAERKIERIG
jgi:hypothetical protein